MAGQKHVERGHPTATGPAAEGVGSGTLPVYAGRDPLAAAGAQSTFVGALANPFDWLQGLAMILVRLIRMFSSKDIEGILDVIDRVVKIVREDSAEGSIDAAS